MIRLEKDVLIERSVNYVFSFVFNFENESRWADEVVRTEKTSEGPIDVGSTFADHVEFMGKTMKTSYEILAFEPDSTITIKTSSGPVPFTATYSFEDIDGATRLSIAADVEPSGFFRLTSPLIRRLLGRQWDRNFANLKALLES